MTQKRKSTKAPQSAGRQPARHAESRKAPRGKPEPRHGRAPQGGRRQAAGGAKRGTPPPTPPDSYWIYGLHPVEEALANPRRRIKHLLTAERLAPRSAERIETLLGGREQPVKREQVPREALDRLLGEDSVHQGVALSVAPLDQPDLQVMADTLPPGRHTVLALDHVTDPHNVGAILRSAAAFGVTAVLTTRRNAPTEGGVLAKAASGALEHVAYIQETNLARALEQLRGADFQILGLAEAGEVALPRAAAARERNVLVLGAEGKGLRQLTMDICDRLIRLPTGGPIGALNVSNAAAVALYELSGRREESD